MTDKWRYTEMNPVRAGLCARPEEYPCLGTPEDMAFLKHYNIPYADATRAYPAAWENGLLIISLN